MAFLLKSSSLKASNIRHPTSGALAWKWNPHARLVDFVKSSYSAATCKCTRAATSVDLELILAFWDLSRSSSLAPTSASQKWAKQLCLEFQCLPPLIDTDCREHLSSNIYIQKLLVVSKASIAPTINDAYAYASANATTPLLSSKTCFRDFQFQVSLSSHPPTTTTSYTLTPSEGHSYIQPIIQQSYIPYSWTSHLIFSKGLDKKASLII